MSPLGGIKGMRHIALKVRDIAKAKSFYQTNLGMNVVWEPDPENVYLSSGNDNIALHQVTPGFASTAAEQHLDHFGFIVESIERVQELEEQFRCAGVTIVHPFKIHRDGSASFYCADPDGIVIQMLYEPQLSHKALNR
jgi:catechol 2,3-dioxygenase-like lactoylglutathione lyase family enzyme